MRISPGRVGRLNKAGVPCGPINTIDQTFADPQVQHLGIAKPVSHPKLGPQKVVGQPIHMSGYPQPDALRPTPDQGEHTDAVLRELGYDAKAIAGLRDRGVVWEPREALTTIAGAMVMRSPYSDGLRLRSQAVGRAAVLGHELVEFRLVLGVTQTVEVRDEFALLFFEAAQGVGAVLVKRVVSTGGSIGAAAAPPALRGPLHPLHTALHSFHATLPAVRAAVSPACHPPTPYQKPENQEAQRPEQDEADNRQRDPGRLANVVQLRRECVHGGTLMLMYVTFT